MTSTATSDATLTKTPVADVQAFVARSRYYRVTSNPTTQFWLLNVLGWLGISLVTYLSLSLPYNQFEFSYLAHNILQSLLGMALSLPMRTAFQRSWEWPTPPRIFVVFCTVMLLSLTWSAARLLLFMAMTGERGLWGDFGGWWFPSIFVFLTWAALYHGVKYHQLLQREHENFMRLESQQRRDALMRTQAESEAREAQLQLLRYQLNPHFLFNTLNAISALIATQRTDEAKQMLVRLGRFLRYSLESGTQQLVKLSEEIAAASLYLEIEKARFSDRLTVELDVEVTLKDVMVPSLLLQPLVENAIKYAISRAEDGGTIRISARPIDSSKTASCGICIAVEDSGVGKQPVANSSETIRTGIGLNNTRARLQSLFGENYTMAMAASELGGLCITLTMPRKTHGFSSET